VNTMNNSRAHLYQRVAANEKELLGRPEIWSTNLKPHIIQNV